MFSKSLLQASSTQLHVSPLSLDIFKNVVYGVFSFP